MDKLRLAIFASGYGSNARNIINHFRGHLLVEVGFVLTNRSDSPIILWCNDNDIDVIVMDNLMVDDGDLLSGVCLSGFIDYIILAGYLRRIPLGLISSYSNRIINIHPSLLPKFGGKGMYGDNVHRSVKDSGDFQTGITIHYIDENFDEGLYIAQFYTLLDVSDSVEDIRDKVQDLESRYFPLVIENTIIKGGVNLGVFSV